MRFSWKPFLRYCLLLFAAYALLLWLFWLPPVAKTSAGAFHAMTMPLVEKAQPEFTFFSKPPEGGQFYDYKIRYISSQELERQKILAKQQGKTKLDLSGGVVLELKYHQIFFNPWFFLSCLILVTPLSWNRKLITWLVSSLLFWFFAFLKINFIILQQITGNRPQLFDHFMDVLVSPGFVGFLVVVIWLLAAFRKSNWEELLAKSEQ